MDPLLARLSWPVGDTLVPTVTQINDGVWVPGSAQPGLSTDVVHLDRDERVRPTPRSKSLKSRLS